MRYIRNIVEEKLEKIYDLYKISKDNKKMDYCMDMEEFPEITVNANIISNLYKVRAKCAEINII